MSTPERNLPPGAQGWGRKVDKDLQQIKRTLGIHDTNIRSAFGSTRSLGARMEQGFSETGEYFGGLDELIAEVEAEIDALPRVGRGYYPPLNPRPGDHWFDANNTMHVWVDYGTWERRNYVLNPTFHKDTLNTWSVVGGTAATLGGAVYIVADSDTITLRETITRAVDSATWSAAATVGYAERPSSSDPEANPEGVGPYTVKVRVRDSEWVLVEGTHTLDTAEEVLATANYSEGGTSTSAGSYVEVEVSGLSSGDVIKIDQIILENAATIGAYFDGTMNGIVWDDDEADYSTSFWNGKPRWTITRDEEMLNAALEQARAEIAEAVERIEEAGVALDKLRPGVANMPPEVVNELWAQAVVTKFLTATEKIITRDVIATGAVTAEKITASEEMWAKVLGAHKIKASEIDANSLKTVILTADSITSGMISSTALDSRLITGAIFRTQPSYTRGIVFSSDGIEAWSRGGTSSTFNNRHVGPYRGTFPVNTQTFLLDEATGRVDMRDRLVVGGSRWLGADTPGVAVVPFGVPSGDKSTTSAGVYFNREASTVSNSAGMWVDSPNTPGARDLILRGYQGGGIELRGFGSSVHLDRGGMSRDLELTAQGAIIMTAPSEVRHSQMSSTTGGVNAKLDTASGLWVLRRDSSSVRYKVAIEPQPHPADAILSVEPKTWFEKQAAETIAAYETAVEQGEEITPEAQQAYDDAAPLHRIPGLIAEEVADAGLDMFVTYTTDEHGNRVPDGLMYDRLWTLLIPLVKELRTTNTELEQRVAALEASRVE